MRWPARAAFLVAGIALVCPALAQGPSPSPTPTPAPRGLAVLAVGDTARATWPLARGVYARPSLRPSFDEAHARVLAGEAPEPGAARDVLELAETRTAVHGDDAPSRRLLVSIANQLRVRGIVVVMAERVAEARLFLPETGTFDAARYVPDATDAGEPEWTGAITSLERAERGTSSPSTSAPSQAFAPTPAAAKEADKGSGSRPFYTSPWFWGALGAAALGGTALYFATRDNGSNTIHLQLQVPK